MEKFIVIFSRIDNQAKASFNGSSYDSGVLQGDPIYPETGHSFTLQPMPSSATSFPLELIVDGCNSHYTIPGRQLDNNPFHVAYKIVQRIYDPAGSVTNESVLFDFDIFHGSESADVTVFSHHYKVDMDSVSGAISITRTI